MLRLFLALVILVFVTVVQAQNLQRVEFEIKLRYDKQADYTTRFFNRSYTDDVKLWGKSFGLNGNYLHPINKRFYVKTGAGYYRIGFDRIRTNTRFNNTTPSRNIDYNHPLGISLLFSTRKYYYNNVNLTVGMGYSKPLGKGTDFVVESDFSWYYTFSQLYHINYGNIRYKTSDGRTLGIALNTFFGISHKFNQNKNYISPKLIVPVYQQLSGDKVFGEDENVKMTKWLHGIGLSVAIGKYL